MDKVDFKNELKELFKPSAKEFSLIEVPTMQFLMVDGKGNPNSDKSYVEAVEALYAVSYKLKFMSKQELEKDYVVPPLEGLWWAENMEDFVTRTKDNWQWTMMIMQPEWITEEMFTQALEIVAKKKELPALPLLRLETFTEGLSVQIMHIGSYDDETPTLDKMHNEYIPEQGFKMHGKHHEIYLSDPRKVAPEKLKTVLRQPVSNA